MIADFVNRNMMSVVLLAFASTHAWSQIELPPVFGHNMVLQKDQVNVIWCKGPPKQKIWMEYKGIKCRETVENDGFWRGALDLKSKKPAEPGPGSLYFGIGKQGQDPLLELTNVVIGRLWLFAGWDNKGIPASDSNEHRISTPERLRFATVRDFVNLKTLVSPEIQSWVTYPAQPSEFERFPEMSLRIGKALLGDKDYIGIIQTTVASLAPGFAGRRSPTDVDVDIAWKLGSNSVWVAQSARQQQMIRLKREGRVVPVPPIYQYEKPSPCLRDSFPSDQPPASLLSFEGAIWPFDR